MYIIFEILFIIILLTLRRKNAGYLMLVGLQFASLLMAPFVTHGINTSTFCTLLNILFVCFNLFLIISPWRFAQFKNIYVNKYTLKSLERTLTMVLVLLLFINILVFTVVIVFIPDISQFKNEQAFKELYDSIPYFSIVFRITAVTQYFGLIAIPISCYYLYVNNNKQAIKYFVLSFSTLTSALAMYSRAGMFTFVLTCVGFYSITLSLYSDIVIIRIKSIIWKGIIIVGAIFITITVVRFNAMDYYADRIPSESIIKHPILYNIFDYASQGFSNGIEQLEQHSTGDIVWGTHTFYNINQIIAFLGISNWSSADALDRLKRTYDKNNVGIENDSGAFHGYVCTLVKDFGYILTFLINIFYYFYVKNKCRQKTISLDKLIILAFLFVQPCVSIFYASFGELFLPLAFYFLIKK